MLLAVMTLVMLLAAFVRIHHITQQSIWFDEAFAWNIIRQPDMFPRIAADTHPPLYYLLLRGWTALTGESALALRSLSMLFGMMSVALVYAVGRELVRLRRWEALPAVVPVFAALLLALTDAEIDLSQEARNYTLYTMLGTLSMWAYLRWMRTRSRFASLLWIAATAALLYTHYYGAFIPAAQGIHVLFALRGRGRIAGIAHLAAAGLIFLPWFVAVTIPQAQNAVENSLPFSISSNLDSLTGLVYNFLSRQWGLHLALLLLGLVALRDVNAARNWRVVWRPLSPVALLLLWLLVPVLVLWFGNYAAALLTPRKMALVTPVIALLIAFGLGNLRQPAAGLLLAAIVVYGAFNVDFYRLKEPWDEIAAAAVEYAGPNDLAITEVGNGGYPMTYYWTRTLPQGAVVTGFPVLGDPTMAPTTDWFTYYDAYLPELLAENDASRVGPVATVWLAWWWREQPSIERLEAAGYVRTMTQTWDHLGNDIDLYRYDLLPETPAATYENGITLHAVEVDAGDLRVDLWWSVDAPVNVDYVTSALLLGADGLPVAQLDSPPFFGQRPTSTWDGETVVFDPKPLEILSGAESLPPGEYTVAVQVYSFGEDGIEQVETSDGARWHEAGTLNLP